MALSAVLVQMLLPSRKGGRVPAAEILMIGYGARQHIRRNALQHIHQEITMTKNKGSITFEESLSRLVTQGHLSREDAVEFAVHPDDLKSMMR
jgi:Tfp pilus assembly pilus retraction ATPase PilT